MNQHTDIRKLSAILSRALAETCLDGIYINNQYGLEKVKFQE
jgi:hypothetical protein